ncbi:hypothetical protein JHK85_051788 [Glycine max]|nr:hypothetical protein JHK85_051788 [Glycine max]
MLGTLRPQFVLFGSSIVQYSYYEGWGATLSHLYARKHYLSCGRNPSFKKFLSTVDGIHLSTEGSKIVTKEILKVLKEAEWKPNLYWRSMPSDFGEDSPYDPVGPDGKTTINLSNFAFP